MRDDSLIERLESELKKMTSVPEYANTYTIKAAAMAMQGAIAIVKEYMGAATPNGVLSREEDTQKTCPAPANSSNAAERCEDALKTLTAMLPLVKRIGDSCDAPVGLTGFQREQACEYCKAYPNRIGGGCNICSPKQQAGDEVGRVAKAIDAAFTGMGFDEPDKDKIVWHTSITREIARAAIAAMGHAGCGVARAVSLNENSNLSTPDGVNQRTSRAPSGTDRENNELPRGNGHKTATCAPPQASEIPVDEEEAIKHLLIDELQTAHTENYHEYSYHNGADSLYERLRPYLRTSKPVSISLDRVKHDLLAYASRMGIGLATAHGTPSENSWQLTKAVLDAAGVAYVE